MRRLGCGPILLGNEAAYRVPIAITYRANCRCGIERESQCEGATLRERWTLSIGWSSSGPPSVWNVWRRLDVAAPIQKSPTHLYRSFLVSSGTMIHRLA